MNERCITKCDRSQRRDTIFLECLALPGGDRPEVEVLHGDGTSGTDLARSDTLASLLNRLGLNADCQGACHAFYLTITTDPPALLSQR